MWGLIIAGGGLLISIIGPLRIEGYGRYNELLDSGIKAAIAILLVVLWVFIMSKIKNWIFHKQIRN
ncbi:MAG: hypothetical protein KGI33_10700 [Thaumarchaeota archaeon]|nr:hypothetical protein [Nitrososphaerota archaeon]